MKKIKSLQTVTATTFTATIHVGRKVRWSGELVPWSVLTTIIQSFCDKLGYIVSVEEAHKDIEFLLTEIDVLKTESETQMSTKSTIKLTELIKIWDILHIQNTGDIGFCDLDKAIEKVGVVIENDTPGYCSKKSDE